MEIAPLQFDGKDLGDPHISIKEKDMSRYKKIPYMETDALMTLTLNLADEQKDVLTEVLNHCKSLVKARNKINVKVKPIQLLVHGGAGNVLNLAKSN